MNPKEDAAQEQLGVAGSRFSQGTKDRASRIIQTLILCLGLGVLVQNIILQRQNKNLKQAQSSPQSLTSQITAGRRLDRVSGVTLDGRFREINMASESAAGSVIMTFSPTCPHCLRNQEGWNSLAAHLKSLGWRVIWVSRDPQDMTLKYCQIHGIDPSDVIADPTNRTYDKLALGVVPFTIVVDTNGTIQQAWKGELGQSWTSVFAYFQLTAPTSLAVTQSARN